MKKVLSICMVLLMLVAMTACNSENPKGTDADVPDVPVEKANEDYFLWDGTQITGYSEEGLKQTHLTIPASCTGFGYSALRENTTVETISFEADSLELVKSLFWECTALKTIELPASIGDTLPEKVFYGCDSLVTLTIPASVKTIAEKAFYDCDKLQTIDIPETVTEIKDSAFAFCPALKNVTFHEGLTIIGESAFESSGIESLEIPGTVNTIGKKAFYMCDSMVSVKILEGVTTIESYAFSTCAVLKDIYLPSSVIEISNLAFTQFHDVNIHVKEGSYADTSFDEYDDGFSIKQYY